MSVLQKKLQKSLLAKMTMPSDYNDLPDCFMNMTEHIAGYLEQNLDCEIAQNKTPPSLLFLGTESIDIYKNEIDGLLFAVGPPATKNAQTACTILIEVSAPFAHKIIASKLASQISEKDKNGNTANTDNKFSMFDVLIMQPVAKLILQQLRIMGASAEHEVISARSLTMDDFKSVSFSNKQQWLKLAFAFSVKEDTSRNNPEKNNPEKVKNNESFGFSLYVTSSVAKNIVCFDQDQRSRKANDPDNPWTQHMRSTMHGARRSLEIVIEDLKLSIADCTRLELGQVISLPGASHERLIVKTNNSRQKIVITTATLGAYKSNKAVKLNQDLEPEFLGEQPSF